MPVFYDSKVVVGVIILLHTDGGGQKTAPQTVMAMRTTKLK